MDSCEGTATLEWWANRSTFRTQPAKWAKAAQACADAGLALDTYADTVECARGQAGEAVPVWKQGVTARKTAANACNASVGTYHDGRPPGEPEQRK